MAQQNSSKEVSGNKMVKIIVGIILIASVVIVIAIQAFYMLWEPPKDPKQSELDKSLEPSYTKSSMLQIEEQLYIG